MKKFKEAVRVALTIRRKGKNSDQDFNVRFNLVRIQLTGAQLHMINPHP